MNDARDTAPVDEVRVAAPAEPSFVAAGVEPAAGGGGATVIETASRAPRRRWRMPPVVRGLLLYALLALLLGVLTALVWHAVARLPHYTLGKDGVASTTERGLTKFFTTDAWYCLLGLLGGLLIGVTSWWLFRRLGAWVTLIALVAAAIAGLVTWRLGQAMGPNHFSTRIAQAHAGQEVPIDFRLHSHAAALVWLAAADLPVLLFSSLLRDADADDDGSPRRRLRLVRRRPAPASGDAGHPAITA